MRTPDLEEARVVNGILARLNAPGGYDAFSAQVRGARACRRPVRLKGRITRSNDKERREVVFDSRELPDGVLLKACGTRRETVCPPCASLYRGDAFALVAAGLRGGKGIPESVSDHPTVFLTLTAPSFGAVHRRRPDGTCHPAGPRCPHGVALVCADAPRRRPTGPSARRSAPTATTTKRRCSSTRGSPSSGGARSIYALRALGRSRDERARSGPQAPALLREGGGVPETGLGPPPRPGPGRRPR